MLFIFLILIIVLVAIFMIYSNKKLLLLKHQLMISNNQINSLKSKLSHYSINKDIKLKFKIPITKGGIIKENSSVLIAPLDNAILLHKPNVRMEVYIVDMVENKGTTWYYVALPLENSINSRGWVKASDFNIFYDNSQNITKKN